MAAVYIPLVGVSRRSCAICHESLASGAVHHTGQGKRHPIHRNCVWNYYTSLLPGDPRSTQCITCKVPVDPSSLVSYREKMKYLGKTFLSTMLWTVGAIGAGEIASYAVGAAAKRMTPLPMKKLMNRVLQHPSAGNIYVNYLRLAVPITSVWRATVGREIIRELPGARHAAPLLISLGALGGILGSMMDPANAASAIPRVCVGVGVFTQTCLIGRVIEMAERRGVDLSAAAVGFAAQGVLSYIGGVSRVTGTVIGGLLAGGAALLRRWF